MPNRRAAGHREFVSLVLTDVEMPEMDGYMLTKQIKATRASPASRC
jgi:CheY-like chemotaxis protein